MIEHVDAELDRRSGLPLYLQLIDRLEAMIEQRALRPGDQVPSEPEIEQRYGVSRATVRQALSHLEAEGIVERHQGKGTYVAPDAPITPVAAYRPSDDGLLLFARYAYPPNERGYCGPPEHEALLQQAAAGVVDPGLEQMARAFTGPWPYLKVMAGAAGVSDPFDARIVEAYWVGNSLLDQVDMRDFGNALLERFRREIGTRWRYLAEWIPAGAVAHHSFHVFGVYPWVGLLNAGRGEPLEILDRCRIRWGKVVSVDGEQVALEYRPLTWDGKELSLGEPTVETAIRAVSGLGFVDDLQPGDWISLHWRWVCDRLDNRRLANLRRYTLLHIEMANHSLAHPGPAMVMG